MKVEHPNAFRTRIDAALESGPARIDRILSTPGVSPLLCLLGGDRSVYWLTYDTDRGIAWVLGVRPPAGTAQIVHGVGCDHRGFRLAGSHPHLVFELLARSHHPMAVVRGSEADFTGVGTL